MDPLSISLMGIGLIGQIAGGILGNNAQEAMMKNQLTQQRMIAARDRLQQVRQLRTATAQVQQAGADQGVGASSSVAGGAASVYGQVGQNINYINGQERIGQVLTDNRIKYNEAQGISSLGADIFSIGAKTGQGGIFG